MKGKFLIWMTAVLCLLTAVPVLAGPSARALIRRSDNNLKSHTEIVHYLMQIISKKGKVEQVRRFATYSKRYPDKDVTLQKFLSPPIFKGTGLLIVDHHRGGNDIWLYLPSSRRIRRISGEEKSNRYMGTEFSYQDFEGYQIPEYSFHLLRSASCKELSGRCELIEARPATKSEQQASGYTKKVYWLEKTSLFPVRVELYGPNGKIVKVETAAGLHRVAGYWRPKDIRMHNLKNGRVTRLHVVDDTVDGPLNDYYVSKRFLRH